MHFKTDYNFLDITREFSEISTQRGILYKNANSKHVEINPLAVERGPGLMKDGR